MRLFLAAVFVLVPAVAPADNAPKSRTPDAKQMKTDDCARARKQNKTCVLDMGTETLEGSVGKNDGERIDVKVFDKMGSMVRIRRDFIAEIIKTAEDL
jgi:hypothetical protein